MPQRLTCPQGHEWELADGAETGPLHPVCPVCGSVPAAGAEGATLPPAAPPTGEPATAATLPPAARSEVPTPMAGTPTPGPEQADAARAVSLATPGGVIIPGYEILGELGRGGMGVVYKARQAKLNRLVALKMILSGAHAGGEERQRFLTEAEAVARLQHPNIVQIHEIGEADGHPFFSLEFCPGGSLAAKLNGTPLPPAQAAPLVETLARAVQAAHEAGVVHRDLKP